MLHGIKSAKALAPSFAKACGRIEGFVRLEWRLCEVRDVSRGRPMAYCVNKRWDHSRLLKARLAVSCHS